MGPRHPDVRRLRSLARDRAARRTGRVFLAEGLRLIEGLLDRNAPVAAIYVEPDPHDPERADALIDRATRAGIRVCALAAGVGERITATVTPQRLFAEVDLVESSLESLASSEGPVLVLVGMQDPGNAGTILRSAEAAGCQAVVFSGDGVDPWNSKVVRASAGAVCGVAVVEQSDPRTVLGALGSAGFTRIGTVARGGLAPDATDLSGPVAFVIGGEARGLDAGVLAWTDVAVTIPMHGAVESLNAGMAATVLAFEAARQRGWSA